jgi:LmbE family N-acetylglucosaminyl deacetylase
MNTSLLSILLAASTSLALAAPAPPDDGKLRIICFGAHPDDCEIQAGGVGAMWAAKGHHVKLVSVTNGDIGHWRDAGGPLARRRKAEVEIVMSPRPNDYHPDHRYTGVLVQDAAYMVTVPFFCPDVPYLKHNPVFLYYPDSFQKPNAFQPDVAVSIDGVIEKKLDALDALESQFYEGGANGSAELIPSEPAKQAERHHQVRAGFERRYVDQAQRFKAKLADFYGQDKAGSIRCAEAFEICEYGRRPSPEELKKLFPFFGE